MANNNHFELTLDTLAPTGKIEGLGDYEKNNKALVITSDGATFKKVWFDSEATPVKETSTGYQDTPWQPVAETVTSAFTKTGIYYYHAVFMDDVNNESDIETLGPVYYDQDKPVVSAVYLEDPRGDRNTTNALTLNYGFDYSDQGAGVVKAIISGTDFEPFTVNLDSSGTYNGTITLPETAEDGNKQIKVVVYDRADNESLEVSSNILVLDRVLGKPTLLIQDAEGINLPEYINYNKITISLTSAETNIVEYQVWEGAETAAPETWMSQAEGSLAYVNSDFVLSSGDGEKTIRARVKDTAGNIKDADARSVVVDTIAPVAELAIDNTIISKVAGFDKAIISVTYTDERSGIAKYSLIRTNAANEQTVVLSGTAEQITTYDVVVGALTDGVYTYHLEVEDNAGNKVTSNKVSVTIDTTAPVLTISTLNAWYTQKFNVAVSYSDANNFGSMYAWVSTVENDTTLPDVAKGIRATSTISKDSIYWGAEDKPAESAANYVHVCLSDEVGNVSYAHAKFGFDSVAPVINDVKFTRAAYPTTAAEISLNYTDATSGVVQMNISGDITDNTVEDWEEISSSRFVTLKSDIDGIKSVTVTIKDAAGLTTTKTITCELDRSIPSPELALYDAENINTKPSNSPVASFAVRIKINEDDSFADCQYQLHGDFAFEENQEQGTLFDMDNGWKPFVVDAGQDYMTITGLYCTVGDGYKDVYVKVMDNAGNILKDPETGAMLDVKASFYYDTTLPVVVVSNIDHNRISKVHSPRIRNGECSYENCYTDECRFTFTPDSAIQAYKVCAYMTKEDAIAGSATDAAIGMTNGSVNMHAIGINSNKAVEAKITGADFELALGEVGTVDGLRWVVVYVQDLAGQWSVAAEFEA